MGNSHSDLSEGQVMRPEVKLAQKVTRSFRDGTTEGKNGKKIQ